MLKRLYVPKGFVRVYRGNVKKGDWVTTRIISSFKSKHSGKHGYSEPAAGLIGFIIKKDDVYFSRTSSGCGWKVYRKK